jgi:hypothetical protein
MSKLRNVLIGAGIAGIGAIGVKKAIDYFQEQREDEEAKIEPSATLEEEDMVISNPEEEVAFALVEKASVQDFLDKSFGDVGRYQPNRQPKIFEYQDKDYMVIWAYDNKKSKNQMLVFLYTDEGKKMIGSVGYTESATDYNLNMADTPFAVEINGKLFQSGKGETEGTSDVNFVLSN